MHKFNLICGKTGKNAPKVLKEIRITPIIKAY